MMRPFFLLLLFATPVFAAERTWTIARDVYTANGELVTVRGNVAYLRIDGRVEEVAIDRLSAVDQQYIASLSFAPILPGPMSDDEVAAEEMPLPGEPDAPAEKSLLNAPAAATTYGSQPQPLPPGTYRIDETGRVIPLRPEIAANYLAPIPNSGAINPNDRRSRRPPQPGPNNQAAQSQRDDDEAGFLGFRERRLERQRAAARSR